MGEEPRRKETQRENTVFIKKNPFQRQTLLFNNAIGKSQPTFTEAKRQAGNQTATNNNVLLTEMINAGKWLISFRNAHAFGLRLAEWVKDLPKEFLSLA